MAFFFNARKNVHLFNGESTVNTGRANKVKSESTYRHTQIYIKIDQKSQDI